MMMDLESRFFGKMRFDPGTECWEWTSALDSHGYGQLRVCNQNRLAHRLAYQLFVGPIPKGLELDHLCRNRACVNPDHLEPVTHAENTRRSRVGEINRSKTHCPQGHEYSEENTRRYAGRRHCRTCQRAAQRRWRESLIVFSNEAQATKEAVGAH